ncbi:MAG: hypothetical protein ACE37F_01830 [Nannocystaceae bacterium]|nr:hypothetical protein [bacterium]
MPVAEPFEQLALDSHMAVAGQGRLFVVITLQPPTVDSLERFRRCIVARHDAVGDSLLGVVTLGSRRPSLEAGARQSVLDIWAEVRPRMHCCAVWIRRDSFAGALQRSLVTGLLMVRRPQMPTDVVATAEGAVALLARAEPSLDADTQAQWSTGLEAFASEFV